MSVHHLPGGGRQPDPREGQDYSGGGDGGGFSDGRLRAVEQDLVEIKTRIQHMATREDLEKALNKLLMWGIVVVVAVMGSVIGAVVAFLK